MRKISILFIIGLMIFGGFGASVISSSAQTMNSEWVIMYYLNGDNKLSAVQADRLDAIQNVGSSDQVNIAILIDQDSDGDTRLYYLEGTELIQQDWSPESNMADAETIKEFVLKVKNDYVSNNYYLHISSNRGSGWQGISWDETDGESIMISYPQLLQALNQVTNNGEDKLDIIGIETCMGGMTEDAYQLRNVADYFVAYEDCGIGAPKQYSFPLDSALSELIANPDLSPEAFATIIPDLFTPIYVNQLKLKTVLAATDLSKMDELADAYNNLADILMQDLDNYRDEIQQAISETRIIGETWDINFVLEPMLFLDNCAIEDPDFISAKNDVISCYSSAVMNKKHLEDDNVCGLSIYLPRTKVDYNRNFRDNAVDYFYEDLNFAFDTQWDDFLRDFLEINENSPPNIPLITGPSSGTPGLRYEYCITVSDAEDDSLFVFIDWGDGTDTGWFGPYNSNEEIIVEYNWTEKGTYTIRVKAKDIDESEWGILEVNMPKIKQKNNNIFTTCFLTATGNVDFNFQLCDIPIGFNRRFISYWPIDFLGEDTLVTLYSEKNGDILWQNQNISEPWRMHLGFFRGLYSTDVLADGNLKINLFGKVGFVIIK